MLMRGRGLRNFKPTSLRNVSFHTHTALCFLSIFLSIMAFKAKPLCSDKDIYGEGLTSNNLALQEYDDNVRDLEGAERKENTQKSGKEITLFETVIRMRSLCWGLGRIGKGKRTSRDQERKLHMWTSDMLRSVGAGVPRRSRKQLGYRIIYSLV
jgi:hypothetical protein